MSCSCNPPDGSGVWTQVDFSPGCAAAGLPCGGGCGCAQWTRPSPAGPLPVWQCCSPDVAQQIWPWLLISAGATGLLLVAANHRGRPRPHPRR